MVSRGSGALHGRGGLRGSSSGGLRASMGRASGARRRARATLRFNRRDARGCEAALALDSLGDDGYASIDAADMGSMLPNSYPSKAMHECRIAAAAASFRNAVAIVHPQAAAEVPPLRQTAVGKRWATDVVAVVHNALRTECADLLDMVSAMALATPRAAELRAFFAWFATFEALVVASLKAEEEVLYPWLEQWGRIDGALATGSRIAAKGAIIRAIRDCAASSALLGLHHLPAGGVIATSSEGDTLAVGFAGAFPQTDGVGRGMAERADPAVCDLVLRAVAGHVGSLVRMLASYFGEQVDALPIIIESLYDVEDVRASSVDRRTIRAIIRGARRDDVCLMLVRGLGDDRALARSWAQRCLRHIDRLSLPLWRRRYASGRGAVVEQFRARKWHLERLARHTTAYGKSLEDDVAPQIKV